MKILWGWDDGFARRRPSLVLEVPDEDLEDLDEREQDVVIDQYVREAFENQVQTYWKRSQ